VTESNEVIAERDRKRAEAAAKKDRIEREKARQMATLWEYYATGGGALVPPHRVANNCGVSLEIAIYNLHRYGRKESNNDPND